MTADAIQTIFNQYQTSVEMLAKRMLGEPYNFHRIQGFVQKESIRPSHGIWQHIILECIDQYSRNASYSSATVAASINPEYIGEYYNYSLEHSEMDLPTAYAYFLDAYGRFVETQIASSVGNWLLDGYSALETVSMADKMRREKSIAAASVKGSDGRHEFEAELFASMEGKIFDHPIKPFLRSMREKTYFYEPEDYIVTGKQIGRAHV